MIALLTVLTVVSVRVGSLQAEDDVRRVTAPSEEMVKKLSEAILKHCPDAKIEVTKDAFVAKDGTMMLTLHRRGKAGEVYRETYSEEGPNHKGFLLRVSLNGGAYSGAAAIPQTFQEPYFQRFFTATPTDGGKKHFLIDFSYGSRLDPELKQAILEAIPKTKIDPKTKIPVPEPSK